MSRDGVVYHPATQLRQQAQEEPMTGAKDGKQDRGRGGQSGYSAGTHVLLLCSSDFEPLTSAAMIFQAARWSLHFTVTEEMVTGSNSFSAAGIPDAQELVDVDAIVLDTPSANTLALSLTRSTFLPKKVPREEVLAGIRKAWGITAPPSCIEFSLGDTWTDEVTLPTTA
jgi:hypothetical protein